jgi:hypothetical protein
MPTCEMAERIRTIGLALVLCLVAAAPASAAFAPDLTLGVDPPTASSELALSATLAQPASDTPVKRFTLSLPAGFKSTGAPGAQACAPAALQAGGCPAASRIGTVSARAANGTNFSGTIHKLSAERFGIVIKGLGGSLGQVAAGSLTKRSNGSLDLRLDQLPALPLTIMNFSFDGGGRSLVRAPGKCGQYYVDGKFTSRADDLALERTRVAVTGCRGVPAVQVANIRLSRRAFKAGRRTVIAWWAARAVDHTNVRIERRVRGRWRVLGVLVASANAGDNVVRWDGRLRDRALRPGSYGVRIQPAGSAPSKVVGFRIR